MANRIIRVNRDFNNNQLLNSILHQFDAAAVVAYTNHIAGQVMYYTGDNNVNSNGLLKDNFYFSDGSKWVGLADAFTHLAGDKFISITYDVTTDANNPIWQLAFDETQINHANISFTTDNPHQVSLAQAITIDNKVGNKKITQLAAGTVTTDAVNLGQLQAIGIGFNWTDPCQLATTAIVDLSVAIPAPGQIDTVVVADGDRVVVKDQDPSGQHADNGIYTYHPAGNGGTGTSFWVRSTDMDDAGEFLGRTCLIEKGATNIGAAYSQTNTITIVPVTEPVKWVLISQSAAGSIVPGDGLSSTGNTFDVGAGYGIYSPMEADHVDVDSSDFAGKGLTTSVPVSTKPNEIDLDVNPDDVSIEVNTSNEIAVKDKGITKDKINIDVAGNGLTGGNDYDATGPSGGENPLSVKPYVPAATSPDLAKVPVSVDSRGVAIPIDNVTIKKNTDNNLYAASVSAPPNSGKWAAKYVYTADLKANIPFPINHSFATTDLIVQTWIPGGTSGSVEMIDLNIRCETAGQITVTSNTAITSVRIIVIV